MNVCTESDKIIHEAINVIVCIFKEVTFEQNNLMSYKLILQNVNLLIFFKLPAIYLEASKIQRQYYAMHKRHFT